MGVIKISGDEWIERYSENAHKICFDKKRPASVERVDYALLGVDKLDRPCGYITVREHDSKTVYWQFGGTFPNTKGTTGSWKWYKAALEWTRKKGCERVLTYIQNDNSTMLKFAALAGFKIIGCRNMNGNTLLEHMLEVGIEIGNA